MPVELLHLPPPRSSTATTTRSNGHARPQPSADVAIFRAALALVGVAVADDAFIHPEPGVAAADHLVSGLVPLACVAVLLLTAAKMPGLLRGWIAIAAGILAIVGGVTDGVRHVIVDRLSGDDVTAILATLAGAVLIVLGVVTLWRTRGMSGPRRGRYARRAALGLAVVVTAVLVLLPTAIAIIATHKARSPVAAADLGARYERVDLTTDDGLRLSAWYVPSRNRAAVIAFPGRSQTVPHARMLARHGYGVLLLDRRGEGESEGDYNAFGWDGEADLRAAIAFLRRRSDVDPNRIGGLGLSVGGELLLQTAAHSPDLRAVVSEGAGQRSMAEHLDDPAFGKVQRWFTGMIAQTAAVAVLSNTNPPDGLADLMPRIAPRATLLIEAERGNPDEILNEGYHRVGGRSSELWKVSTGGHTGALAAEPSRYEERVVGFFGRNLRQEKHAGLMAPE
ncbi:MAG: alpha/beta hydrolase [Candidatus Limnocylindria bacterium]